MKVMNRDIKVTSWRLEPCEVLINVMHSLAHPPKITTSRHCNLRNASLPAIFIGLGNYGRDYFVPLTDALSSTDTNTFATHLPPRDVAKQPAKNPTAETCRSRFEQL